MDGGVVSYYAGGWREIGPTAGGIVTKELLPITYSFRLNYLGASVDQSRAVAPDPSVRFYTGRVVSETGSCIDYYASGWQPFSNPMELLPGTYAFRFGDGIPQTEIAIVAQTSNAIH
jgi:hypothetical protein